jgi:uncharacterized protein YqeY
VNGSLGDEVRAALHAARKDRDQAATLLYSTILSDIRNRELELAKALDDVETVEVLRRGVKRRREALEAYTSAGRRDLAEREQHEITLLEKYLPPAVAEEEIRAAVRAAIGAGAADLGALMGTVMPQFKGRADGKTVNRIAREELTATP